MLSSVETKIYSAHKINDKMPTIVGILTFISMINYRLYPILVISVIMSNLNFMLS